QAAAEGDAEALAVMDMFADWVALGLANLITLLDSSLVVIGGGLVAAGDVVLEPVRAAYTASVMAPDDRADVRIVAARLGELAGAIGAALLGGREAAGARPGAGG
ncbi:MAG TPA: ROK family protein, partial [Acidimicrobiales bacterium]